MSTATTASTVLHLAFGGLWTGSVLFVAVGVLPAASGSYALDRVLDRLAWVTRASALVVLLTGGHLFATGYTVGSLTASTRGLLVLAMVALWLALTALVEAGVARGEEGGVRLLQGGAVVAILVLVDAGLLAGGL
jgi:predicted tellurium resistance membrane protein TerC